MMAIIETTNSKEPIVMRNLKYISVTDESDDEEIIKDDFHIFPLYDEAQYTFVGDFILHVLGDRLEYVQFRSDF